MSDGTTEIIVGIIVIAIIIALIGGAVKTFRRNWIAALLLLIFIFPAWVVWAFFEMFTGDITEKPSPAEKSPHTVNVTVVQQADGTSKNHSVGDSDQFAKIIDGVATDGSLTIDTIANQVQHATKICHYCAEEIKASAIICRFCNRDV